MRSIPVFAKWLFSFISAIAAGLAVYWITINPPPPPPINPCSTMPEYLAKLECLPPSFPGATKNIIIEFKARGPNDNGAIRSYYWTYKDQSGQGRSATFMLTDRGKNKVSVTATDVNGCTVTRHCEINVQ